jgi:hypothetical protein
VCFLVLYLGCSKVAQLLLYNAVSPFVMSAVITLCKKLYSVYRQPCGHSSSVQFFLQWQICKNYPRCFNRDVLHRPLCEESDKIPEGRTSTYILHLSAGVYMVLLQNVASP